MNSIKCKVVAVSVNPVGFKAPTRFRKDCTLVFPSLSEARQLIGSRKDGYFNSINKADRQFKFHSLQPVSVDRYIAATKDSLRPMSDREKAVLSQATKEVAERLASFSFWNKLRLPPHIHFVAIDGPPETGVFYCREASLIAIPKHSIAACDPHSGPSDNFRQLKDILTHEMWHIVSRQLSKPTHDRLYSIIGFEPKPMPVLLPPPLKDRFAANPDAVRSDYQITLTNKQNGRKQTYVTLPLYRKSYEKASEGERRMPFFHLIDYRLAAVEPDGKGHLQLKKEGGKPITLDLKRDVDRIRKETNYWEKVGENTDYTWHPEEIMADTFRILIDGNPDRIKSPEKLIALQHLLNTLDISREGEPYHA